MSSKRAKKKKQKQLSEKQLDTEILSVEQAQDAEDIPSPQTVEETAVIEELPEKEDAEVQNDESSQEPEVAENEEFEEITQTVTQELPEDEQVVFEQKEKEEFAVMMQGFKDAVEQMNVKDPDEETLIRLFGECDTDSHKEKVIENPYEIVEKEDRHISHLVLKILYAASALLFTGVLFVFGAISFFDEDKLVSQTENRTLTQKPALTFSALFSGEYTVEYENYYSDNFPARDFFIGINGKIKDVLTRFSAGENTDVIISVDKTDDDFAGEGVDLGNQPENSDEIKENTAEVTPDNEASIKGSIIVSGNRAMEIYTYNESDAKRYASVVNKTAAAMPEGVKFYSLVAPTAVEFYGTKTYREGIHSQRDAIKNIYSKLGDNVITVDAYSALVEKSEEYIYFRTDHHWTARGAYYAYTAFCNTAGVTAPDIESFVTHKIEDFVGSLYRSSQAEALKKDPDYVECFELLTDATNTVYTTPEMTDGIDTYIVAKKVNADNKYLAFISGDQPLEKITTDVANGKKILVLKESFGNAFVPFLCNNYEEVYVVDPRKMDMYLPDFVKENGIQEVLAINYCFGISNSRYCNELEKLTVKEVKE
ncbi:MAG: hypothetical protein IJZ88_01290 [Clostridia bacterium]|nr:hypothetical protein [Clostridia bacterium]